MLQPGAIIELVLPERTEACRCRVLSCSSTMISVRLQELGTEHVHRVSLKKLPYTVIDQADGAPGAEQHQDQQPKAVGGPVDKQQLGSEAGDTDEEGGNGSEGDAYQGEDAAEQQQRQQQPQGGEPDAKTSSDSDGNGSGSEEEDGREEDPAAALDAFSAGTAAAVEAFTAAVEFDPSAFLQPAPELASLAKSAARALYYYQAAVDSSAAAAGGTTPAAAGPGALPELYIDGFDAEQVWLQLELAAAPAIKRARKLLRKVGQEPQLLTPETEEAIDDLLEGAADGSDDDMQHGGLSASDGDDKGGSEDEEGANMAAASLEDLNYDALLAAGAAQQRKRAAAAAASDSDEEVEEAAAAKRPKLSGRAAAERAKVEDEHFKLDEMEAFVQQAEHEAAGLDDEEDESPAGSDEEEAALEALLERAAAVSARDKKKAKKARRKQAAAFGHGDVGEGEEDEDDPENVGKTAMFEDFFGPRTGGRQGAAQVTAGGGRRQQLDAFDDASDDDDQEEEEEEEGFQDDLLSDDMLSGEEEEGEGQEQRRGGQSDEDGFSDEEEEDEEEEEEDAFEGEAAGWGRQRNLLAESDDEEEREGEEELAPSAHERRQQRMAEKIRRLEEAALGEKDWFMRGEVDAAKRPKNSALEVDLDFETTVKPPPQPTEEMTRSLDELIKGRIAEGRFDDVVRLVAPPPEVNKATIELDDSKPQQGLGELYEADYVRAVAGAADDKDEVVRQSARAQFSALCAKLDALSHLHFTPRPVIEEVTVKVDVPAIMMEEAAPQFVSGASMRAPEEVFASEAGGAPRADEELEREDRKRRRAQRKRAGKKRRAGKEEERAARAAAQGGTAPLAGRKSEAADREARKLEKKAKKGGRSEFGKSAKVFGMIQQHVDGTTAAARAQAAEAAAPLAAHLKL